METEGLSFFVPQNLCCLCLILLKCFVLRFTSVSANGGCREIFQPAKRSTEGNLRNKGWKPSALLHFLRPLAIYRSLSLGFVRRLFDGVFTGDMGYNNVHPPLIAFFNKTQVQFCQPRVWLRLQQPLRPLLSHK